MRKPLLPLWVLYMVITACGMFPDSSFVLSDASRLPKWFALGPGMSRSQVTVEMAYYVSPSGRTATFILKQRDGQVLARAKGQVRGLHPVFLGSAATDPARQFPAYELVTVNGITEVMKHQAMEPIVYVEDDPETLKLLGVAESNKKF